MKSFCRNVVRAYLEIQPQFQYNKITKEGMRLSVDTEITNALKRPSDTAQYDAGLNGLAAASMFGADASLYCGSRFKS